MILTAKEACGIADIKNKIIPSPELDDILEKIKIAASNGEYMLYINYIPQQNSLNSLNILGYSAIENTYLKSCTVCW